MRTQPLFRVFLLLILGLFVGCLPTYVGNPDTAKINPDLIGLWHRSDGNGDQVWGLYQMNEHTYLAQHFNLKKNADAYTIDSALSCRVWLSEIGGQTFMSMQMFQPQSLLDPKNNPPLYIVAKLTFKEGSLEVRGVEPDFVKHAKTPAELEKVITDNLDKPALYIDAQTFKKITPENRDAFSKVLEAID